MAGAGPNEIFKPGPLPRFQIFIFLAAHPPSPTPLTLVFFVPLHSGFPALSTCKYTTHPPRPKSPQREKSDTPRITSTSYSRGRPRNLMKLSSTHFYHPHPALSPPPALGYDKTAPPDVAATEAQGVKDPASLPSPTTNSTLQPPILFPRPPPPI